MVAKTNLLTMEPAITLLGDEYFHLIQPNGLQAPNNYTDKKALLSQFAALATNQLPVPANFVLAGPPSAPDALPAFRALVDADIPNVLTLTTINATTVHNFASGGSLNFNAGDVLVTHSANALAFTGASSGYTFDALVTVSGAMTATTFSGNGAAVTNLNALNIATNTVPTARLGGGVADATTFLRGDQTWASPAVTVADGSITFAKIQDLPALSVIGRSANSTGVSGAISATPASGAVLRESGSVLGFGTIVAAGIASNAVTTVKILDANVTYAKIQNLAGLSVMGRSTNSSGVGADITGTANQVLVVNSGGTALAFGAVNLASGSAVTGDLPFANLTQGLARSVLGVTGNATADVASIQGATDQVLVVNGAGTALTFATVATGGLTNNAVTFAKFQQIATDRLVGRDTAATGNVEEISVGGGLEFSGSTSIQRSALTGDVTASAGNNATTIANDAVSNAKLANMAVNTIKARFTTGTGDPEDVTPTQLAAIVTGESTAVWTGASGNRFGVIPFVATDGVMEIGRYIDFHNSDASAVDNAVRLNTEGGTTDLYVNSNIIYRAGGTDVPVADGGTGVSSLTAYAVICGGTTSTGAVQSIASVGTSGHVLTSNGAGALPTFQAGGGAKYISRNYGSYATNANLTVAIPFDDTIPQNTEGTEIITATITPASTTNRVRVRFQGFGSSGAACCTANTICVALFQDSGANAIQASSHGGTTINSPVDLVLEHEYVPATTSTITLRIRVGAASGTMRMNGTTSQRRFGGIASATLVLEEIMP